MVGHLGAFLVTSLVVIVTPGPDTALTIRNTLVRGRRGGLATAAGVSCGQAIWALGTAAGVATLLKASQPAFLALRIAGAAYLVYLGGQALLAAGRRAQPERETRSRRAGAAYRQGILSNLGNPKMAVFFVSLLPQFSGAGASFAGLLALGLVFSLLTLGWLSAYAFTVARCGDVLRRGAVRRALDALTGVVLVGLGLRLATERV